MLLIHDPQQQQARWSAYLSEILHLEGFSTHQHIDLHALDSAHAMGADKAKADGGATIAAMKKMPTDDECFGKGTIREDGRKLHPAYLWEVKKPSESKGAWDYYKPLATTPAEDAFRPAKDGACPLVKA